MPQNSPSRYPEPATHPLIPSLEREGKPNPVAMTETVRIPKARLDPLLLQAEEMITVEIAASQRAKELREINNALVSWKTESEKWKGRGQGAGVRVQVAGCTSDPRPLN
jgi:hypothetical protein